MITINIDPIIVHFGGFALRWYSLILLVAGVVGVWLTAREAERRGFKKDDIYDAAIWIIFGGLIGARLFHVLDHWSDRFAADPIAALYIWEGGLAIWGALVGGALTAALLARKRGWNFGRFADAAAPGLVLAQAIGRVACVITGDAMGKPTNGPFGFAYTSPHALVPELGVYYTPMPIYELIVNLGIFVVLWQLRKHRFPDGMLFLIYLSLYSLERFSLAFTSSYKIMAWGMTQSQIVALIGLAIAIPVMFWLNKRSALKPT
jgi:phosphatidylglycerol---prolipoprotein diacylglyceryl transferase